MIVRALGFFAPNLKMKAPYTRGMYFTGCDRKATPADFVTRSPP